MNKDLKIPFDTDGNMLDYPIGKINKVKNHIFYDMMRITNCIRGRSSVRIILINPNGKKYSMFLSSFIKMVKETDILEGQVEGYWYFVKKGANYGLEYLKKENNNET